MINKEKIQWIRLDGKTFPIQATENLERAFDAFLPANGRVDFVSDRELQSRGQCCNTQLNKNGPEKDISGK